MQEPIDQAYQLSAATLVVLSGPDPGESARPQATQALIDSLKHAWALL